MLEADLSAGASSFDKFKRGTMFIRELESLEGVSRPYNPVTEGDPVFDSSSIIET